MAPVVALLFKPVILLRLLFLLRFLEASFWVIANLDLFAIVTEPALEIGLKESARRLQFDEHGTIWIYTLLIRHFLRA